MKSNSKIDFAGIRSLYWDALLEKLDPNRKSCPSPESIIKVSRNTKTRFSKKLIERHIVDCPYCAHEIQFVMRINGLENELLQHLSESVPNGSDVSSGRNLKATSRRKFPIPVSFLFSGKWICISAAATLFVSISLFLLYRADRLPLPSSRGYSKSQLILTTPISKSIDRKKAVFKWRPMVNSEYYVLELFDEALRPVWKSPRIFGNRYQLPQAIKDELSADQLYFWTIRAVLRDGMEIDSRLEFFRVKK